MKPPKRKNKLLIKKQNMPIILPKNWSKIWKRCTRCDRNENNKNWSMRDKFSDKRNKEDNKEIKMFPIN